MEAYEYDGSSTESETYEGAYESGAAPYIDTAGAESINILALSDALASQHPPAAVIAPEPTNPQQQLEALTAVSMANAVMSESQEQEVIIISEQSDLGDHSEPAATGEEKPHPACAQCNNLLLLIDDGGDEVAPQGKLQCNCCKRTFARKVYSKNQSDRQQEAHCPACTGNHQKCRGLEKLATAGPLICRSCLQEKPANDFSRSQKMQANDAIRRCRVCIESKFIGPDKRAWRQMKLAANQDKEKIVENQIGKIMFAWKGLERRKADFERRGAQDAKYGARLKRERNALKFREISLRKRDADTYDKVKAKLAAREMNGGKKTKKSSNKTPSKRSAAKEAGARQAKKPRVENESA